MPHGCFLQVKAQAPSSNMTSTAGGNCDFDQAGEKAKCITAYQECRDIPATAVEVSCDPATGELACVCDATAGNVVAAQSNGDEVGALPHTHTCTPHP